MPKEDNEIQEEVRRLSELAEPPDPASLATPEAVKAAYREIYEDADTKPHDQIAALREIAELSGFTHRSKHSDLARMDQDELNELVMTLVIPVLEPYGVKVDTQKPDAIPCVRCDREDRKIHIKSRNLCNACYQWAVGKPERLEAYPKIFETRRRNFADTASN